jgi:hypothetical protein
LQQEISRQKVRSEQKCKERQRKAEGEMIGDVEEGK